jgi:superfamily II DNA/RNA helicase
MKLIIEGHDLVGLANTGTGKTAAFLLPLIHKVFHNNSQKVLIIAPTRELAQQIDVEFKEFASGMRIYSTICVGGTSMSRQISGLRARPNFVIGTPGRLKDLSNRNFFKLSEFQNVVLDEVDRMLDMGFIEDIKFLLAQTPKIKQTLFFSATIPPKISLLINDFLHNPITVEVKTGDTAKNVEQDIIKIRNVGAKLGKLEELLSQEEIKKTLIFIETKREVEKVTKSLIDGGFKADSIHGNKNQNQRQRALNQFRNNSINILVATDVAARGLDIKDISHVINYTIPNTYNDYVHRIGRTGRCDKKGFAYTFVMDHS